MTRTLFRCSLALIVLLSMTLSRGPAEAHSAANYYPSKWPGGSMGYRYSPGFPGPGAKRDRINESFQRWTDVQDSSLAFSQNSDATDGYTASNPCGANATYNGIFWNTSVSYGRVYNCVRWNTLGYYYTTRWSLVFEENTDAFWNGGTGDPDGGTNYFKSVAMHETGHAGGFGTMDTINPGSIYVHFSTSDEPCYEDPTYHTMCTGLHSPVPDTQATLEYHDIETVQNAY